MVVVVVMAALVSVGFWIAARMERGLDAMARH